MKEHPDVVAYSMTAAGASLDGEAGLLIDNQKVCNVQFPSTGWFRNGVRHHRARTNDFDTAVVRTTSGCKLGPASFLKGLSFVRWDVHNQRKQRSEI